MQYNKAFTIIKELEYDREFSIYSNKDIDLYIYRPSKLKKRFADYDKEKNFQIWLRENDRKFRPNHLRVFIDLNLRVRSKPDTKIALLRIFDDIYNGKDPNEVIRPLKDIDFQHFLNPIPIIANLSQLFIIEQNYCYNKVSMFDPPSLFYQGWVRTFIDSPKEIDNLCMSVANRQPPLVKYTKKAFLRNARA